MNTPTKEDRKKLTATSVQLLADGTWRYSRSVGNPKLLEAAKEAAAAIKVAKAKPSKASRKSKQNTAPWWTVTADDYYSSGVTLQAASAEEAVGKVVIEATKRPVPFQLKSVRAATKLEVVIAKLEAANKAAGIPEFWRVHNGKPQRGYQPKGYGVFWEDVQFLSTELLARYRDAKAREVEGIPY